MQPESPLPFEIKLKAFHERAIWRWHELHGQLVGVSIQVGEDSRQNTDNCTSTTRDIGPHVNPFCADIQRSEELLKKCDMLDQLLKKKATAFYQQHEKTHQRTSLGCRCHQGVSNFLTPYVHPHDQQKNPTKWYIFIGQFALEQPKNKEKDFALAEFKRLGIVDLPTAKIASHENEFIKPSAFAQKDKFSHNMHSSAISSLTWLDFLRFHSFLISKFEEFLLLFLENGFPNAELSDFIGKEEKEIDGLLLEVDKTIDALARAYLSDERKNPEFDSLLADARLLVGRKLELIGPGWHQWFTALHAELVHMLKHSEFHSPKKVNEIGSRIAEANSTLNSPVSNT